MNNIAFDSQLLTALMACPRKANYQFTRQLVPQGGKSNSLEAGSICHFILEHYNKARISGKGRDHAITIGFEAGREYINGWKETNKYLLDPTEKGVRNTPEEDTTKPARIGWKRVLKTMEEFFDFRKNDSATVLESETVHKKVIYEDNELRILWKAKFDAIHDWPHGIYSTDYKSMQQQRPTLELNNQFMGQAVLLHSNGVFVQKIGFQKTLAPEEKFERVLVSYSDDALVEWTSEIVPHYARMLIAYQKAEYFPPNFTQCETKYGLCPYLDICKNTRNMREEVMKNEYEIGKKWDINND